MSMIKQEKSRQESFKIVFDAVMQHVPHDEEVLEALHQLGTESTSKFRFLDALEERYRDLPIPLFNRVLELCDGEEYECIRECAERHGINRKTMEKWLSGRNGMPARFKEMELRYANKCKEHTD